MEWVVWLIAAAALGVGEMLTLGFFLAPFALGALVATLASAAGAGTLTAGLTFVLVSIAGLVGLRPVARRHLRTPARLRTGAAALVGRQATVVDRVSETGGAVRLDGELWSARPYDETAVIEPGARVHVIRIRGATALVSE